MTADGTRKRVLITGAGGRIGASLAEQLRDRYDLRLQYHHAIPEQKPVEDFVVADIANYEQIAPALAGIDAVIHMAGEPSPRAPWADVHEANIVGCYNVFEAARLAGVKKIIFASTNTSWACTTATASGRSTAANRRARTRSTASRRASANCSVATSPTSMASR
jgi:nucleoside-diphosphate-sugar epimerase